MEERVVLMRKRKKNMRDRLYIEVMHIGIRF
jgi:hypothetical protein